MNETKFALVLSGGGVKGAWEAGFLQYVAENWGHKFSVVCGSSAGAMNGAMYCSYAHDEKNLPKKIVEPWNKSTFTQIVGLPFVDYLKGNICSLLDNSPLIKFIQKYFNAKQYRKNIDSGVIDAFIVTTTSLSNKLPYLWIDTKNIKNYESPVWIARKTNITKDHIAASGAIPVAFKPHNLEGDWHVDGGVCFNTPLQPAIMSFYNDENGRTKPTPEDPKTKILVIAQPDPVNIKTKFTKTPNIFVTASRITDSIFVNSLLQDISKAKIINNFLTSLKVDSFEKYRKIDILLVNPEISLDDLAADAALEIGIGFLPNILTTSFSTLFIVQPYIQRLLKTGYDQARAMHAQLDEFFNQ